MSKPARIIQCGLGAIGRETARLALTKQSLQVVGAVDRDPKLVGRDLGEVLGLGKSLGIAVAKSLAEVLAGTHADAVIHCTGSSFVAVYDQLVEIARAGLHCVTSCEEALFPYYRHRKLAGQLDDLCLSRQVAMVGTGVNPGLVMDTLALALTVACQRVEAVRVLRVVDVATRREALQRKVGVGLDETEFGRLGAQHKVGHVGLAESLVFLADGLGWNLEQINESLAPVICDAAIASAAVNIRKGQVSGVRQFARGLMEGRERLTLELQMYAGAPDPRDRIEIEGDPPLRLVIEGGVPGDAATPAVLVNTVPQLVSCRSGLHTMRTLGLPHIRM
jgi:hypothetical protein